MKYCLTSKVQKRKKFMDLNPELWGEISTQSFFFTMTQGHIH